MNHADKPLIWISGEVKTPPLSRAARLRAGYLLRALQKGEKLPFPHSRPIPFIGTRCHELRIADKDKIWRIIYRLDRDVIVILDVFQKRSQKTPKRVIDVCRQRIRQYDSLAEGI